MKYDAIVIGTGQSGPFLATRLADAGAKVAIIERKFFGGTCVNAGRTGISRVRLTSAAFVAAGC